MNEFVIYLITSLGGVWLLMAVLIGLFTKDKSETLINITYICIIIYINAIAAYMVLNSIGGI